ncbi:hypothetical protein TNCT_393531 [Trichonephila clavata]|uniref:Uncharacterized protein n=1 Tax=Trichonephila clavata TaxID=2740835 RepID=A0A8X6HNW0_TRICU|nr:hypothetical protein TNCT_393531 [Trichonephila clavata]
MSKIVPFSCTSVNIRSSHSCELSPSDVYLKIDITPRKRTRIVTLSQHTSITVRDIATAVAVGKSNVSSIVNQQKNFWRLCPKGKNKC